jgi:hypothetical protein
VGVTEWGAGLEGIVSGSARLVLRNVVFSGNRVHLSTPEAAGSGAGAFLWAQDDARIAIDGCRFERNLIDAGEATDRGAAGAGLYLIAEGRSRGVVARSEFRSNAILTSGLAHGAGLRLFVRDPETRVTVRDSRFVDNLLFGSPDPTQAAAGAWIDSQRAGATPGVFFLRNWLVRNGGPVGEQLRLVSTLGGRLHAADSIVADGAPGGVLATGEDPSYLTVANFTVVDHSGPGLRAHADYAKVLVHNTIAFDNGSDMTVTGDAFQFTNLVAIDPRFVDRAAGDYRLRAGSPARDAGATPPPPLLGSRDAYGQPRLAGASIDIGAAEYQP